MTIIEGQYKDSIKIKISKSGFRIRAGFTRMRIRPSRKKTDPNSDPTFEKKLNPHPTSKKPNPVPIQFLYSILYIYLVSSTPIISQNNYFIYIVLLLLSINIARDVQFG